MIRLGVIPTNGRECVVRAVNALLPQVNYLAVVMAGPDRAYRSSYPEGVTVLSDPDAGLNISRWWNIGLTWAEKIAQASGEDAWDVAIINDDVIVPSTWFCYVADDMRSLGCKAACSGGSQSSVIIHRAPGPISTYTRMQGFAFVIAGESGLRADEDLCWWYQDDKLGADAASAGGMAMFPNCHVQHLFPNGQMTPDMQVQIGLDRGVFVEKMGYAPW
jgi:hypothetical protein